jgi:hypothetical protein
MEGQTGWRLNRRMERQMGKELITRRKGNKKYKGV